MANKFKKILFINFGGLGDEILFLPSIISVKKEFPNSHITLALEPRSKGIVQLTNIIDETIFADIKGPNKYFELLKLLFIIWTKKFDIVISSGGNKFISLFLFFTFIKKRYGYNSGKHSELFLTESIPLNKEQYAVNMYHDLVSCLTSIKTELPEINVERKEKIQNSVLIHPGVSLLSVNKGMIKTVSAEIWAEVVSKLSDAGKNVILAGGPDDKDVIEAIQKLVPTEKYTNYYGKTKNLKELAELMSTAEIFLCSDSAPLHIAVSLGVKTYVIFGPTDYKKLIPVNGNVIPITADCDCNIQPCLWEKRQTSCEKPICLNIPAEKIVSYIL